METRDRYPHKMLLLAIVLITALVGSIAASYSTHLAPDIPSEPCPMSVRCLIDINGTIVEEASR